MRSSSAADGASLPLLGDEEERRRHVLSEQAAVVKRAVHRANEELTVETSARRKRSLLLTLLVLFFFTLWRLFESPQALASAGRSDSQPGRLAPVALQAAAQTSAK